MGLDSAGPTSNLAMTSEYDPVFLPNESILAKKYKVGDTISMKVTEVMDDGVRAVCSHGRNKPKDTPEQEMSEHVVSRYREMA